MRNAAIVSADYFTFAFVSNMGAALADTANINKSLGLENDTSPVATMRALENSENYVSLDIQHESLKKVHFPQVLYLI